MGKTILVAEDFNVSRKIIVSTLVREGYRVIEAADGLEALELFDGRPIDLMITDFNMPRMTGGELVTNVRTLSNYQYLPILLLTTEVREDKLKTAFDGNITGFIKKPFDTADFLKVVKKALQ